MNIRVGIIGVGNIGSAHAGAIYGGMVKGMELGALCDISQKRREELFELYKDVPIYEDYIQMLDSGRVDAVIIATPHYFHPKMAEQSIKRKIHTLTEKPIGVFTKGILPLWNLAKENGVLFAIMLNQRTNKLFKLAKELIDGGRIGQISYSHYEVTNWYRTEEYYRSATWRGSWQGEGGGVLINQAPHNLDLWCWLCGMPKRLKALCREGAYHNIEVEDYAEIFAEYQGGAVGVFIASTGIENGKNRLEIKGERGTIILEKGVLTLTEGEQVSEYFDEEYNGHLNILENFASSILTGEKLISPAICGLDSLTVSNGAYLSSWKGEWVDLPLDEDEFLSYLEKKIEGGKKVSFEGQESAIAHEYLKRWSTSW
ncbi:MAG: Gfo/Idh/MocA family oxidoreductase [Clostridia bacterium]|nr:Gfo/Idh/MocA family oxidoreductase [Clostridia bacterium]